MINPGTRLGPYEILAPIGAGGMGEVYKARDARLDRTVAIKVLPSHLSDNVELKRRFEREARAVSSLNHPHICTLYDIGQQEGVDYLVMEYLEGETLADRLEPYLSTKHCGTLSRSRTRWIKLTDKAWFIGISSRATSCSPRLARSCWISDWRN
jgi:serine/threonine protein kinase